MHKVCNDLQFNWTRNEQGKSDPLSHVLEALEPFKIVTSRRLLWADDAQKLD